jgi:predicted outer membrane repeat protein
MKIAQHQRLGIKVSFLFTCMSLLTALPLSGQLLGDGSMANPYSGFLSGNLTISGTKYFNGNLYVDDEILTVSAGAKLIAVQNRASIFVTGTGRILAVGTKLSPILFSCDIDLDGINGESGEYWGNININSSGASQLIYCTVENGRKDFFKWGLIGGGLRVASSAVTVTNSTFRNCVAEQGGAIAVVNGATPSISACIFLNNSALKQGGAIYTDAGSAPLIENSLFNGNSSASLTLKGGTVASIAAAPRIVNSTIVNSSSPVSDGTSLYLENSPGAIVVNNVIWGGSNHVGLSGTPSSVLEYNAIEGATYAGNLTLSSVNSAPDGPNFINPSAGDFNIAYTSVLRDSGAETYPGITIPDRDIIRSSRIHIPDRGAYEMIYSRWNGKLSNSWTHPKNWEGAFPPGNRNVVIPAGLATYPVAVPGPSFTLNAGLEMIVEAGARVTFASLTNNGTIEIRATETDMASVMTDSYSGSAGNLNVELFLKSAPPEIDRWHYIASPVTVSKTVFTDIEPENLLGYDESKVVTSVAEGWQWHDGYDGTTPFSNLEVRKGYNVFVFEDATMTYSNLKSLTTSLGQINLPFSGSGGDTSLYGYSLLGNSLTCGINWDAVTFSDSNVRDAYYIRTETGEASYVNGVGTNGGTAHLPPMQGFFVKTRGTGTWLNIPASAREHNATPRFKSSVQIPLVRLTLVSPSSQDEMVIRFEPSATMNFDHGFDAGKIFNPVVKNPKIYSVMGGENYSINSIPWPEKTVSIPLTVLIPEGGTYTIRRSQLQATGNYRFMLTDRLAGRSIDFTAYSEYSFSAVAGTDSGRFILTVTPPEKKAAPPAEPETVVSNLKIYAASGKVCVLPQGSEWDGISGKVRIFDITGRMIVAANDERFNSGELKEYHPSSAGGLLIVEVMTGGKRYLEKIVLTRD